MLPGVGIEFIIEDVIMARTISIGAQNFAKIRENGYFYVDKTDFIRQWWESGDDVTLITRPRRFGKTLNMSMIQCFCSPAYKDKDLFDGLSIRNWDRYDELRGQVPVISISFAKVKTDNVAGMKQYMKRILSDAYTDYRSIMDRDVYSDEERRRFYTVSEQMDDVTAADSINQLCGFVERAYGVAPIVLVDEYDTPMVEAWMQGYWDEAAVFMRSLFNSTFKTNSSLGRAIITGITRISKESLFSDLNCLNVISTTTKLYETSFGFTEAEVFQALDECGLGEQKQKVRRWYDGYKFGNTESIYNPWSITSFLKNKGEYDAYWGNTAGTGLLDRLIGQGSVGIKSKMEDLMQGKAIKSKLDEQVVFSQLDGNDDAVWSLLLATGYLTYDNVDTVGAVDDAPWEYTLRLVNLESRRIFTGLVQGWFARTRGDYGRFIKMMLADDLKSMNDYMRQVVKQSFSFFDSGENAAESFYHAFVLGMVVDLQTEYTVESNKESGYGRYDVCICPKDIKAGLNGYVLEFKLYDPDDDESGLADTVARALAQIECKDYATGLVQRGLPIDRIRSYGFGFNGKEVLIGRGQ